MRLLALAKRAGSDASDVLADSLTQHGAIADYAMLGLAVVSDDRGWTTAYARLEQALDRPTPTYQPRQLISALRLFHTMVIIIYLLRHLDNRSSNRTQQLIHTLRSRFDRLHTAGTATLVGRRVRRTLSDRH